MKKVLIIFFISISILALCFTYENNVYLTNYDSVEIYTKNTNKYYLNTEKKNVMGMSIYKTEEKYLKEVLEEIDDIVCVQYTYKAKKIEEILNELKAKIVLCEHVDEISIYYAYSKKIDEKIYIKGNCINVQIAVKANNVQVGIPFIAGSY